MALPDDFWKPWETVISSFDEFTEVLDRVFERWASRGRVFVWRGAVNASWPLHSSLYRRLALKTTGAAAPMEYGLSDLERRILADVHRWGLHNGARGRMPILEQLASLQHFRAPTRFIDVSFNVYIGLGCRGAEARERRARPRRRRWTTLRDRRHRPANQRERRTAAVGRRVEAAMARSGGSRAVHLRLGLEATAL
ncbi:MAG: FRG domain-containing protein [Thermoleophilia bacterium]|nr:FRG domain-containing protein [Thermoleophilia bacterium]